MTFKIDRCIEIDAGHRVPTHGSKCANPHGHRYKIFAECQSASLTREHQGGAYIHLPGGDKDEQRDMVMDFGFLKEVMMHHIDRMCDHGMILWCDDPWAAMMLDPYQNNPVGVLQDLSHVRDETIPFLFDVVEKGHDPLAPRKLLIVPFIPTAERLAEFWYNLMKEDVHVRSNGVAYLNRVSVWETPNCCASYPA
jgi:6-pyruvoyltetrahydropterin/6-carboxytetrahydropterin synthase